jgi:hypothetical protein
VLAGLPKSIRTSATALTLLVGACFDPDPTPLATESSAEPTEGDTTSGTVCTAGETQVCACPDGLASTQVCNDAGSGFGSCACEGAADSTTTDSTTTVDPTTGTPPECTEDAECASMAEGECQVGVCADDGMCMVESRPEGTACGDDTEGECSGADACDGRGTCAANDASDGTVCSGCPLGVCACQGGACGDCVAFAPENNFITTRSVEGWELTGGWALYREAPQNFNSGPTPFGNQVLGTDGNRIAPYPGSDNELSSARSGPMILPASLDFSSWNVDEGTIDTKRVRVSNDGGVTFVDLADCATGAMQPFCQARGDERAPDDWDLISLPVPPDMVGDVGLVELTYNTQDGCCQFEKGWYVDVTNFAGECACAGDEGCGGLGGECGVAACGASGECELDAVAVGSACGDATDVECNDPDACDGAGYCSSNEAITGLTSCEDCPAGLGSCNVCQAGACADCVTEGFEGWFVEDLSGTGADWQIYFDAPPNLFAGSVPVPLSLAPAFGTDGNRQAPYPGAETEHSRITTLSDLLPASITFASWNVDEGTNVDTKIIEVSVDGGATWTVLVSCDLGIGTPQPFCLYRDDGRLGTDWDLVEIPTGAFAGQTGQLRFTYNTLDACCEFERGWFISDLAFAQYCLDSPFP